MFARSRLFFSVKNDTKFAADKITGKNKKQLFYEKGIYSKILHPEDNGMDKGEGDKDDGKNDDGGKNDGSSGGNNGDAGNVGGEPQPTPDNNKSESESGKKRCVAVACDFVADKRVNRFAAYHSGRKIDT